MKSYEAIGTCVGKHSAEVAKALHLSRGLVYRWMEPAEDWSDSGAHNPLDRLEAMVRRAQEVGQDDDAYEPIRWLCEQFGFTAVRIPNGDTCSKDLTSSLLRTVGAFSGVVSKMEQVMEKKAIPQTEVQKVEAEVTDLVRQAMSMLALIKESSK